MWIFKHPSLCFLYFCIIVFIYSINITILHVTEVFKSLGLSSLITVTAQGKSQHSITVSSGPFTPTSGGGGFSSSYVVHGRAQEMNNGARPVSQNGSTNCIMDSSLESPARRSMYNKVSVYPRKSNMEYPEGTTVLPMSDETWVACSHR